MTVFEEILKIPGVSLRHKNQGDQDYFSSILEVIRQGSMDEWDKLSTATQLWFNSSTENVNGLLPIVPPEGYVVTDIILHGPEVGRIQAKAPNLVTTPKIEPALPVKKASGVVDLIRKTIILNPNWPTRKVHQYITENGFPNTKLDVVAVNAGDIRRTIAMIKALGYWRDQEVA